ncbi:MAG: Kelch repeat-containing protein [Anaerolineales bacterium]
MENHRNENYRPIERADEPEKVELSEREHEILRLVATGASNKEIAHQLVISANTVKVHLRNIFAKVGVASRTEATLYAIREGLVQVERPAGSEAQSGDTNPADPAPPRLAEAVPEISPAAQIPDARRGVRLPVWAIAVLVLLLISAGVLAWPVMRQALSPGATPFTATAPPRWQASADMPTARSSFAVATYENQIYAVGGETSQGVTGVVERYDPAANTWATLKPKPAAVADVSAALIGGRIYVPGGRLASGTITSTLAVYDPRLDRWEERAPLPVALSAYALAAFEGKLYIFGGWDGEQYLASVYVYDPGRDEWSEHTPMPTPRGHASVAVAAGKIYVIGGTDGEQALAVNEEFGPEAEASGDTPWQARQPLPEARSKMAVASIADIIYVVGGEGSTETSQSAPALEYFSQKDQWQPFEGPFQQSWSGLGLAGVSTNLYAFGGLKAGVATGQHLAYQAIYTIVIPIVK